MKKTTYSRLNTVFVLPNIDPNNTNLSKLIATIACLISIWSASAQYTSISDPSFEAALATYDDIANDGQVPTANIGTITILDISNKNISDLTGIEDFLALKELIANDNPFTSLDLTNNTVLEILNLTDVNALTTLNINGLINLTEVSLLNTDLSTLDLTTNVNLTSLIATSHNIEYFDLRKNTLLEALVIVSSVTKYINVQNGNNENISSHSIYGDTNLCVAVDNLAYAQANWRNAQSTDIYNEGFCRYTTIPDANFETALLAYDDIANDGQVPTANIETVTELDVRGNIITDPTGIEDFTALQELICSVSRFSTIDLSANINLEELYITNVGLSAIDLSTNTKLKIIDLSNNSLNNLDLSNNTLLESLDLDDNNFSSIDISALKALSYLRIEDNSLSNLDVSQNTALTYIDVSKNNISSIDFSNNPLLESIDVTNNSNLASINLEGVAALIIFEAQSGALTSLDFSDAPLLHEVYVSNNQLTSLDFSNNPAISFIAAQSNSLLSELNLRNGNTERIKTLNLFGNDNLTCISVSNVAYAIENFNDDFEYSTLCGVYTYIPDANFEAALVDIDDITGDGNIPTANIKDLTILNISGQGIADLTGIEGFESLIDLDASLNNVSEIDLSSLTDLQILNLNNNELQALDFSSFTNLTSLDVNDNALFFLSIQNGVNGQLTSFNAEGNSDLTCILVDDETNISGVFTNIDPQTSLNETNCTTYLAIPDSNFEDELSSYDDIPNDNQVPLHNVYNITKLNLSYDNISDLSGIEAFTALKELDIDGNDFTTVDLSKNIHLEILDIGESPLTGLDLSQNVKLRELDAANTDIVMLDLSNNVLLEEVDLEDMVLLASINLTGCTLLKEVDLGDCNLSSIDLSTNTSLENIDLQDNNISTVDFSNNTSLQLIDVNSNNLSSINLSGLTNLIEIEAEENQLSTIDISTNTALTKIDLSENTLLTALDVSNNVNLLYLSIDETAVETLDISQLSKLIELNVNNSALTTLEISNNPDLNYLDVSDTQLVSLDLRRGFNTNGSFRKMNATGNSNLTCIMVDEATSAVSDFPDVDAGVIFSTTTCGYTLIPDANFEAELAFADDVTGDGKIPTANIETIISLDIVGESISDLTGIEAFTSLERLYCGSNSLTSLDVSNNTSLMILNAAVNNLVTIDVSKSIKLESLIINRNNLTSIDITNLSNLNTLSIYSNDLSSIDVSNNVILETLSIREMSTITALDISQNIVLKELDASSCSLTDINLSNNPDLIGIYVDYNNLTSIDLSNNTKVEELFLSENQIGGYLDVSDLESLIEVELVNCNLTGLNLKNGNNTSIGYFDATDNPNLTCIRVDDVTYTSVNWAIDPQTSFSETSCDMTAPVITLLGDNPVTVEEGSIYTDDGATAFDNYDGDITADILVVSSIDTSVIGTYTVTYNVTDAAGNVAIEVVRMVNIVESCPILSLPVNNFNIQTYSETCSDKNNGIISIDARQELSYIATINNDMYAFNDSLNVSNVAPGGYTICIAIDGYANCEQCFELVIEEAPVLTGKTSLHTDAVSSKIFVEVDTGTAPYKVLINDDVVGEYATNSFYLDVNHGDNVAVLSSNACEGKLSKSISLLDNFRVYPNPTRSDATLVLPSLINSTVEIEIHNTLGVLVTSREYNIINGSVVLPLNQLSSGVYFVTLAGNRSSTFRIVKK